MVFNGISARGFLILGAVALFWGVQPVVDAAKPTGVPVASMQIQASLSNNPHGYRLLNDGKDRYVDFQLPPESGPDKCVNGEIYSTGLAFMRLNHRKFNNILCSEVDPVNNVARQVSMIIADDAACLELVGSPAVPCLYTTPVTPKQPHVRIESAFKNKATKTLVQIQFHGTNLRDYHINSDIEAPMSGSNDVKVVTYGGTATLYGYTGITGSAWEPIGNSFVFPFEIIVTRNYVPAQ